MRIICLAVLVLAGCGKQDRIYTLYRSSTTSASLRMHIATFNAVEGEDYNRENCLIASDLFAAQPGVRVRYWCEKGRFRP